MTSAHAFLVQNLMPSCRSSAPSLGIMAGTV
jgi:hypothetical protein